MTTVINMLAGPGAGKSTTSAQLFVDMKNLGLKVELVQEYVKQWAWDDRQITDVDSFYITCKQLANEARLYNKVDYVITDSPIILHWYYDQKYNNSDIIRKLTEDFYIRTSEVSRVNVWIDRDKPYQKHGRFQTEDEAKLIDTELYNLLEGAGDFSIDLKIRTLETNKILTYLGINK